MELISQLSIFVLACFVGYYVVWSVTPALHTPLMAVTNAISSVIIVGALIAASPVNWHVVKNIIVTVDQEGQMYWNAKKVAGTDGLKLKLVEIKEEASSPLYAINISKILGLLAVALAAVNIFGGFAVTQRMLAMYKKKEKK